MENWVGEIIVLEKNNTIPVGLQALLHYCDFLQNSHDQLTTRESLPCRHVIKTHYHKKQLI
jgi:hypothetical protein